MKSYILLENIEFYSNHGVLEQEKLVGNIFIINLKIGVDTSLAAKTDDILHTVNYAEVYGIIEHEMSIPSKLIEHVAGRIINKLRHKFPQIEDIELKLSKRNPPIGGQVEYASVIFIDNKPEEGKCE